MLPTEFVYKLHIIRRMTKRIIGRTIEVLFVLASLATLGLMAYEYGYSLTDEWEDHIADAYRYIMMVFFFGSLIAIALHPKETTQEKGFWIEVVILLLLLFLIMTQTPEHFPKEQWLKRADPFLKHILLSFISIIQLSKTIVSTLQRRIRPEMMFAGSFLLIIFVGAALLMLPRAHRGELEFIDALFTSTSAVCITGLSTVELSTTFTMTGQTIILLLIQIGGVGVMTFTSFIAMSFFTQTSFTDQMALKNILSEESMNNIFRTLMYTFFTTLVVEAAGTWVIWWEIRNVPHDQIPNHTFFAAFHAISAFCNAGFSTLPGNLYNPAIRNLYGFQAWIAVLIIIGGIGFPIVFNYGKLLNHKIRNLVYNLTGSSKRMPSHVRIVSTTTRVVITTTVVLLVVGTALFWLFENDNTLQGMPLRGKIAASFLGATTPRTAGFNNLPTDALTVPTVIMTLFLMWVGASPLSTGGGIKTTTFTLALKSIFNTLRGKENLELFKRRIPEANIRRAYVIILLSVLWIVLASLLLAALLPGSRLTPVLFEVVSAASTVGLSLDFTPQLNTAGKIIISLTMFVGRVGLLSLLTGMIHQQTSQNYTYAEDNVIL